ncbi:calcitonin gene-related peptide type 1 receptor isoform X2 [Strongylocentrotus purpuratus]|uniref:Calcitonin receptor n=1 Tax=Strongylocentrotus purpuratus TaxID=7668 RepID=A0A7M7P670_STRPU|nr:calcitonin gene-related peptide type 1 receptor isoform X2 [Strongylocentrotus purpuratus]|eukprot:XP_011668699.1 PREDICTED: calcitonin gene-related peptide type 1 receptor isoform X2 [Strongylocentrotus purpuratus]
MASSGMRIKPYHQHGVFGIAFIIVISSCILLQISAQTIATEEEAELQEGDDNNNLLFGVEHKNAEQRDKHHAVAYECMLRELMEQPPDDGLYCNLTFDYWDCWNFTRAGEVAVHPCPWWIPSSDSLRNATKICMPNGEWYVSTVTNQTWTNYSTCYQPVKETNVMIVFYVGYSISIIALSIALFIFFNFKSLSCPRVTIHKNLFFSFIFDALFQITFFALVASNKDVIQNDGVYCKVHNVLKQYFQLCNYFWMLSEGLYLHTVIVVAVFSAENHQLVPYFIIGWAIPIVPACLYAGFVAHYPPGPCWVGGTPFEWLIAGFVIFVLAVNLILLLNIVRVLVTKLRATPMAGSKNYTRAVRATLILLPLLGLHYIILPAAPPPGLAADIYSYVMAVILSFQGLFVACIFCFFNGEVKMQVRRKWFAHHWWRRDSDFRGRYANTTTVTEACTVTAPVNNRISSGDQGCPLLKKSPNFIGNGSTPGGSQRSSCSSGGSLAVKYRPGSGASTVSKTPEIEEIPEVKVENYSYKMNGDIGDNTAMDDDMVDVVCPLMESVELSTRTTEV